MFVAQLGLGCLSGDALEVVAEGVADFVGDLLPDDRVRVVPEPLRGLATQEVLGIAGVSGRLVASSAARYGFVDPIGGYNPVAGPQPDNEPGFRGAVPDHPTPCLVWGGSHPRTAPRISPNQHPHAKAGQPTPGTGWLPPVRTVGNPPLPVVTLPGTTPPTGSPGRRGIHNPLHDALHRGCFSALRCTHLDTGAAAATPDSGQLRDEWADRGADDEVRAEELVFAA